jgi:dihydrofolate reductase
MLIYSMSVSVDGFIADREGGFEWTAPSEEMFGFHLAQVRELGGYLCGRRLYETMLVWETDPSLRDNELDAAFADVWCALPKVVFSRTLDSVQGNARLAEASLAQEAAAALGATDKSRSAAPAWPRRRSSSASSTSCACSAIPSSSVAARRSCRRSPNTSRWT